MATDKQKWCLEKLKAEIHFVTEVGKIEPSMVNNIALKSLNALIGEVERHEYYQSRVYNPMIDGEWLYYCGACHVQDCTTLNDIAQKLGWVDGN